MSQQESLRVAESSSSKLMEQSTPYEGLIALGKRLVNELKLGDSVDTLGRWMAHHLAELIQEAERATGEDRSQKQYAVRDAILELWRHRAELPAGARPFAEFEPIFRVLESLAPDTPSLRFINRAHLPKDASKEAADTQEWLTMAESLDRTAKLLIAYCLASGAKAALDSTQEWVKLATEAGQEDVLEVQLYRLLHRERELIEGEDLHTQECGVLGDRRERLDAFISLATKVRDEIDERLRTMTG